MPHWSGQFEKSYADLSAERQRDCDSAVMALSKQEHTPGLRVKPMQPDKYYQEARLNSGDRIVFRIEGGVIYFVDVVKHDDIRKYGKRPRRS
ncbi:MAG: hypothetical protein HY703_03675 [Gemmatimonadetes bacterium]|nr:hypothetical protein [Gemmatimonadota bacterium]